MTARRLAFTNKKVRGIPRRLRAIKIWAESLAGKYPLNLSPEDRYWNLKIPALLTLVQGKQTSVKIQSICAQQLINAAHRIYLAKPNTSVKSRVTCCVVLPDMFASEICIYTSEEYFKEQVSDGPSRFGVLERVQGKSLAQMWGLEIPTGFSEIGVSRTDENDDGISFVSEHWYFGEIGKPTIQHGLAR